jgi:hypothetical protein
VIIKPGELFCIHWRGKRLEFSLESVLERFPFGFDRINFLQLFPNELGIQAAGSKLPLNSGSTMCFVLETGLDESFGKLSIVKISGGLQLFDDVVDCYHVSAGPEKPLF